MKAMVRHAYGGPEVLRLAEVETPAPGEDEVLVEVHAASLNLGDWELLRGKPPFLVVMASVLGPKPRVDPPSPSSNGEPVLRRLGRRLFAPRYKILGFDVAGRVAAVGKRVTKFQVGDEVFGLSFGAFAEYVCVAEDAPFVRKPARLTFEQAAALPQASFIALQAIRDVGRVQSGQQVLVVGAGGGAGTLAVQLAKLRGAEVTGVDNGEKLGLMRSIGADHVVDYTTEDFGDGGRRYDFIFDMVAHRSAFARMRSLMPGGLYLAAGGTMAATFESLLLGPLISKLGHKRVAFLMADPDTENLLHMAELVAEGSVSPIIDRRYPLSQLPQALQYMGDGHALGKIIITM